MRRLLEWPQTTRERQISGDRVRLRVAAPADAATVLALWAAHGGPTRSPIGAIGVVERLVYFDPQALILAEIDGRLIGTVVVGWDGWRCHLYRLAVLPAERRRGIASRLVDAAIERAHALGATRIDAMVDSTNELGTTFWESSGFLLDGSSADGRSPSQREVGEPPRRGEHVQFVGVAIERVVALRVRALRLGDPFIEEDFDDTTHHFVLHTEDATPLAAVSVGPHDCPGAKAERPLRFWAMAVDPDHQGRGTGRALFSELVRWSRRSGHDLLWANARLEVVDFYLSVGMTPVGAPFLRANTGREHILVTLDL